MFLLTLKPLYLQRRGEKREGAIDGKKDSTSFVWGVSTWILPSPSKYFLPTKLTTYASTPFSTNSRPGLEHGTEVSSNYPGSWIGRLFNKAGINWEGLLPDCLSDLDMASLCSTQLTGLQACAWALALFLGITLPFKYAHLNYLSLLVINMTPTYNPSPMLTPLCLRRNWVSSSSEQGLWWRDPTCSSQGQAGGCWLC